MQKRQSHLKVTLKPKVQKLKWKRRNLQNPKLEECRRYQKLVRIHLCQPPCCQIYPTFPHCLDWVWVVSPAWWRLHHWGLGMVEHACRRQGRGQVHMGAVDLLYLHHLHLPLSTMVLLSLIIIRFASFELYWEVTILVQFISSKIRCVNFLCSLCQTLYWCVSKKTNLNSIKAITQYLWLFTRSIIYKYNSYLQYNGFCNSGAEFHADVLVHGRIPHRSLPSKPTTQKEKEEKAKWLNWFLLRTYR